ncbi:MAG: UDP-N-acetyl-D-glucosamine dehydrogenase [Candidatus Altiarchaeales archaeon HGW-Altiarchaeales-2]|nr:MAG: UDP-N-acetyl-D-glucosamine dehydrogenase [Candidatus Altiarchaeales archaeon HGW-Altiarchaeales-2]
MNNRTKRLCIFGLGYVGLPLACLAAEKDYCVVGVDIDERKISMINKGISPIDDKELKNKLKRLNGKINATRDALTAVKESDIIIICVPTPVDENYHPNLEYVKEAAEVVSKGLKKEHLVILESTVAPMTTENILKPILETSGLKCGEDFHLCFCPERIDPGNKKFKLKDIPRVVGGINKKGTEKAEEFYNSILDSEVLGLSSPRSAEAVKIMENTFRDINIAFVNEMAKSFDRLGIDITEVLKGASTKPFAFMPHYPGCGVGGHCISVDPYYLIEQAGKEGFEHRFLRLAREINNSMPEYTVERVIEGLNEISKSVKNTKISVLGLAYKGNIDDTRESPAFKIIEKLKNMGGDVKVFDPYVPDMCDFNNLDESLNCECIVLVTDHNEFKNLDLNLVKEKGVRVIVDGRNALSKESVKELGIIYKGIGT